MSPTEAMAQAMRTAGQVGRLLGLLGGLVAFGYGVAQALGYQAGTLPGPRLTIIERRVDTLSTKFDGLQMEHQLIFRRLDGSILVMCARLKATEREVAEVCHEAKQRGMP